MKHFLLSLTIIGITLFECQAQAVYPELPQDSLSKKIYSLTKQVNELQNSLDITIKKLNTIKSNISVANQNQKTFNDDISDQLNKIQNNLNSNISTIDQKIVETQKQSNNGLTEIKGSLTKNTTYWIIATTFAIILVIVFYILLRRSVRSNDEKTMKQLQSTRKSLEEESIRLDNKLVEILQKQLALSESILKTENREESDHTLALKVADEIVRIQKNLSLMDDEIKGKKQLIASVERIRSNFEANGYDIVDMLNKPYPEGLNASVSFKEDETVGKGLKIITRIIKPQVNYHGVMIQPAQLEVSQNI